MIDTGFATLALAAASVGALHSLAPDHWVPLAAVARARGWSAARTARVTLLCGFGHVTVSVVLGLLALLLGSRAIHLLGKGLESGIGAVLVLFGLAYGVWGLRKAAGRRLHGHTHAHYDHVHDPSRVTAGALFLLYSADPCIALVPILAVAGPLGPGATLGVVLVYEAATLGTMAGLALSGRAGAVLIRAPWIERYADAMAGGVIATVGLLVTALGI